MYNSPCKDCKNRYLTCHCYCKEYKAFQDKLEKAKCIMRESKKNDSYYMSSVIRSCEIRDRKG